MIRRLTFSALLLATVLPATPLGASHGDGAIDLLVRMTGAPNPVVEGGHVTYSIDVSNKDSMHPANLIEVTQVIPNASIVAASGRKWECAAPTGSSVRCFLHGALPGGTAADPLTIVAQAPVDGPKSIEATASALSRGHEQTPTDNIAQVPTTIEEGTSLQLSMYDTPDPVTSRAFVKYGVTVTNHGDTVAKDVTATHGVSAGTFFGWADKTGTWSCSGTSSATCSLTGGLAPGLSAPELEIFVKVPQVGSDSSITATATATASNSTTTAQKQEQTTVQPLGQDQVTSYIPPEGACITTNPSGECTILESGGLDALSASAAGLDPDSGATASNNTFGDASFPVGPGGVASMFEGSDQLAICTAVDPIDPADCAGAALDVIVPPGYDSAATPIRVHLVYDISVAPTEEDERRVYYEKPVLGTPTTFPMTECNLLGVANPSPCFEPHHRIAGNDLLIPILMLSQDPKYQG